MLAQTVDEAADFLSDLPSAARSLATLRDVGLGYPRLGQPATELSGGEAQRIKPATELQRAKRGHTLYVLDEPTTGLHPADVELLERQLHRLVDAGNTVVVAEHDMAVVARADHVIDLGPGGGDDGGAAGALTAEPIRFLRWFQILMNLGSRRLRATTFGIRSQGLACDPSALDGGVQAQRAVR